MTNTRIIAGSESFDIGCRVIKWNEPNGFDFHKQGNYKWRNLNYSQLKEVTKQVTVHWANTYRSAHMFNGLNSRKLSCAFMIDDDCNDEGFATIYQCLDLTHYGWDKGKHTDNTSFNPLGPGIEMSYMADAWEHPNRYSETNRAKWGVPNHDTIRAPIHGTHLTVFLPTEAQYKSLCSLLWGLKMLFPDIPAQFPKDNKGNYITTVLKEPLNYTGFVNHYNLQRSKVDAAGIDLARIETDVKEMMDVGYQIYRQIK